MAMETALGPPASYARVRQRCGRRPESVFDITPDFVELRNAEGHHHDAE